MVGGVLTNNPVAIGTVANQIAAFQKQYQAASPFSLTAPNPNYVGSLLDQGLGIGLAANMYAPNFRTPRSVQMNIGIQREIRAGMILSADFVRNVQTHYFPDIPVRSRASIPTRHHCPSSGWADQPPRSG